MRGTKLLAWRLPPVWQDMEEIDLIGPKGSRVLENQLGLKRSTLKVLESIAGDVRKGLLETVGVESSLSISDGRCSVVVELPSEADAEHIARSIDAENVEAWHASDGKVCIAINPWFSTKDVDQTVLSAIKVIHVLLGMHAVDPEQPQSLKQKLLKSVTEIMRLQNRTRK